MRILAAIVVWAAAVVGAVLLSSAVARTVHSSRHAHATTGSVNAAPSFNPTAVRSTDKDSLLVAGNFTRALAIARRHLGGGVLVENAEIYPGQFELQVILHGRQSDPSVLANGTWQPGTSSAPTGPTDGFRLRSMRGDVPTSLLRRIAAAAHVRPAAVVFIGVHPDPLASGFTYNVYQSRSGVFFRARSARGPIEQLGGSRTVTLR